VGPQQTELFPLPSKGNDQKHGKVIYRIKKNFAIYVSYKGLISKIYKKDNLIEKNQT
jgi:hypothetical protein